MTDGPLHALGAAGLLAALLVLGHVLGDAVFQTRDLVRRKRRHAGWIWLHALILTLVQAVVALPLLSWWGALVVLGIGVAHGLVDLLKITLDRRRSRPLFHFLLDQALHLTVLAGAWWIWRRGLEGEYEGYRAFLALDPVVLPGLTTAAVLVSAYLVNGTGVAALIGGLLRSYNLADAAETGAPAMGRTIGILERMLALTLVLLGQWGALGLVVAAKSIARFKDLERRSFSEYYLIGTLASLLAAVFTGLAVRALL